MGCHRNRAHAGAAAAVGNAEGLVQVEVADIGAIETRLAQAHLGVEVGAIEVNLAAAGVHQLADTANSRLKHAVGGGIGDHQRRQLLGVGSGLGLQVGEINVAGLIAGHRHHLQAGHHGAGWVCAVGTGGNQANGAMGVPLAAVPGPDRQQAGIFPLGAGIGLQRHAGKTGDQRQPALQIRRQKLVPGGLPSRSEGVQLAEGRPAHRRQLGGGIELHGAATQRDHPVHQR